MILDLLPSFDDDDRIDGQKVYLRQARVADYQAWADLRRESAAFLKPWEPRWAQDSLTKEGFKRRVKYYARGAKLGESFSFLLFARGDDTLLGGATLSGIRRGSAMSASLGYWMGAPHAGHGYMTDGVMALLQWCFDDLHLHRIEAACIPGNMPSTRVLEKAGFTEEGFARGYRRIDGRWQDHRLFAINAGDPIGEDRKGKAPSFGLGG